jgi:hypothetical protein
MMRGLVAASFGLVGRYVTAAVADDAAARLTDFTGAALPPLLQRRVPPARSPPRRDRKHTRKHRRLSRLHTRLHAPARSPTTRHRVLSCVMEPAQVHRLPAGFHAVASVVTVLTSPQ